MANAESDRLTTKEIAKLPCFKPEVGCVIAWHASPTAKTSDCLISVSPVPSTSFCGRMNMTGLGIRAEVI